MAGGPKPMLLPMVVCGAVGAAVLLAGLLLFVYYEPLDRQASNANARISGVYRYDPGSKTASGDSTARFVVGDIPAAVVDWRSLPPDMVVAAHWYDENGQIGGGVEPQPAGGQPADPIPFDVRSGADIPPGGYVFVVERYSGGRSVEVLARGAIKVDAH